ncbi:uncharacterized protein LOC127095377 [Lathyrus oleraceus]|uniref:uncharacterized protein LOC127095377 n=1 Tax=Pisum sativum TaxID=3888 RepID=UPI0021D12C28|nr:uncharacterized protein LOC127095377 [Pisum sativum]
MINLEDVVLDVAPLSIIHPSSQKKATPFVCKNVKTYGKSFEPIIPSKDKTVVEEESRSKGSEMRNPIMNVDGTENPTEAGRRAVDKELRKFITSVLKEVNSYILSDVQKSLAKETRPDNESSEKVEESVPEHDALERRSKKKEDGIVTPGITKRLQRRKGRVVLFEDSPSWEMKRKSVGLKGTPSRSSIGKSHVEKDVQDITPVKRSAYKKPHVAMPEAPPNSVSLHYVKNVERWKYVIQRNVALERELGKDALKCKEVVKLIETIGLMKTVTQFGHCHESLIKEFMLTILGGCDDVKSVDYGKVYVRGNVVTFSPTVINKFLGRTEEPQAELEVINDQVCKEITAKQVPGPATSKKSVIAQLKKTYKELEDSIRYNTATKIKLDGYDGRREEGS